MRNCIHGQSGFCSACSKAAGQQLVKAFRPETICKHPVLSFDHGGFHIVCEKCQRRWGGLERQLSLTPDFLMRTEGLSSLDKRIDPLHSEPPIKKAKTKR